MQLLGITKSLLISPEFEGIKTHALDLHPGRVPLLISPEFEGIKTMLVSGRLKHSATDQPRIRGD